MKTGETYKAQEEGAFGGQDESRSVGCFISSVQQVPPDLLVKEAADRFFQAPHLDALAIVDRGEPVGLITRQKFLLKLFRRFGLEIYGKNPIITIADGSPLIIEETERLDIAIDKALERQPDMVYDEIIVAGGNGCFKGLLSVRQLVIQQSSALANSMVQKEIATKRAQELEKINRVKSQFIAHVTHELRSPVNAIIGLAELLRIAGEKGQIAQIKERLSLMISSATNLRAIITNILDLSKIEAGKMEVVQERFELTTLLEEIAETAGILIGDKPVVIEVAAPARPFFITSDPVKLRQVLMNLISNAAKFTEQGHIRLSLAVLKNGLELSVSDTGIGIKQEHLDRLFMAFSQIEDAKTKRYEGTGLGLAISRSLAQALGGGISVSSEFGKGTVFVLTLPLKLIKQKGELHDHE
jgi:signal transduction histidine kinase